MVIGQCFLELRLKMTGCFFETHCMFLLLTSVCIADKLDEDYLYGWYRTLYRLFSKAGFHLFHTSSHDALCLQVTLMQSCVYFLAYVRHPGTRAYTMQPPADHGE